MNRTLLPGCLMVLGLSAGPVAADEWRPARLGAPQPVASPTGIQLGRPVSVRKEVDPGPLVSTSHRYAPESSTVVRAQGPDGIPPVPGGAEEQFNCGVVSEGPGGHPLFGGSRGWFAGGHGAFNSDCLAGRYSSFQSDHCFDNFVSPMTNPFLFEDPRALTEIRPIFMYQKYPGDNSFFTTGDAQFYGLQARVALTDRWSIVMHKLGWVVNSPGSLALAPDDSGLSELWIGPKWTFLRSESTRTVGALGLNIEIPLGSSQVFQDTGSTALTPYISMAQEVIPHLNLMGTFGYRFALDNERSEMFFLSGHLDYGFFNVVFPFIEANWFHYTSNGSSLYTTPAGVPLPPFGFEGRDLYNFGSGNVSGNDSVTLAAGVRFKFSENVQGGIAYEIPISGQNDLIDYRITFDLIFRY